VEPNLVLLKAADSVEEAFNRQGDICSVEYREPNSIEICSFPWNHSGPHSWEPAVLQKQLERAPAAEIRRALADSQQLAEWKEKLLCAELARRETFTNELVERGILIKKGGR
jgi:hypothetical protein